MKDLILKDYLDLFYGKKEGHLTKYMYCINSSLFNDLVVKNKNYYLFNQEVKLIKDKMNTLSGSVSNDNVKLIELGPGGKHSLANKTVPVVKDFLETKKDLSYLAVDISQELAIFAANFVKSNTKARSEYLTSDYNELKFSDFNCLEKKVLLFLGANFCSLKLPEISGVISSWRKLIEIDDYIITSLDTTRDPEVLEKAYDHEVNYKLGFSIFEYFKKHFNIEAFDHTLFEPSCDYNKDQNSIHIKLTAQEDQSFEINGHEIKINRGDSYKVNSSIKHKASDASEIFSNNGFDIKETIDSDSKQIKMFLLQKK